MRFTDQKDFEYDPALYGRQDVKIALGIYAEYTTLHSPRPYPKFYEVDRNLTQVDELWHVSLAERTVFSRIIDMPVIIKAEKPDWRLTRVGIVPQQKYTAWMSRSLLEKHDWFPMRGDVMYYNGYRNMIVNVVLDPNAFWQQTNIWLGLLIETTIPAEGDAKPLINPGVPPPAERLQTGPLP